jgi:hypothetical protein
VVINNPVPTNNKKTVAPKEKIPGFQFYLRKKNVPVIADNNPGKNKTNDHPVEQDNPFAKADIPIKESLTNPNEKIESPDVTPGNSQSVKQCSSCCTRRTS